MTEINITIDGDWLRRVVRRVAIVGLIGAVLYPAWLLGGQVTVPGSFAAGQVIRAADINANFSALQTAVNDNDTRLTNMAALATGPQGPQGPAGPTGSQGAAGISTPIGGVVAWLKSLPGAPALPAEFVECNGQVLADPLSPFNGLTLPDLNGGQRYLRGSSTSGTLVGGDTHTHTFTSGTADSTLFLTGGAQTNGPFVTGLGPTGVNSMLAVKGTNSTESSLPASYEVVWVLRVK